jgi:glycerol kinase
MSQPAVLAIDQGTTNTKVILVNERGEIVARASRPMKLSHPQPGWAEQPAEAIWMGVAAAIAEVVERASDYAIVAVAIANQRETIMLWDAITGQPVGPAISWQCRRSSDLCAALRAEGHEPFVIERTGLGLDPLFSAGKLAWLLQSTPESQDHAALRAGTVDSWLLWNLTDGAVHATDHGNAARTQLLNLATLEWDVEIAGLFGVPPVVLPELRSSDSCFGVVAAGRTALPAGVPIHAVMGDSHAALFAHGVDLPGSVKVTIGTGSSLMTVTDESVRSRHGLSRTIAWSRGAKAVYALEGNITVSGQVAAFATMLLGLGDEEALTALAATVDDSDGVVFVPALAGLGAPHWQDRARGLITGLSLRTRPAHVARAALEAIAFQISDVFLAMEADLGEILPKISADGGATRNALLLQLIADLLDRPVARLADPEASGIGAAKMAFAALGFSVPPAPQPSTLDSFAPAMERAERDSMCRAWQTGIHRAEPDL